MGAKICRKDAIYRVSFLSNRVNARRDENIRDNNIRDDNRRDNNRRDESLDAMNIDAVNARRDEQ